MVASQKAADGFLSREVLGYGMAMDYGVITRGQSVREMRNELQSYEM